MIGDYDAKNIGDGDDHCYVGDDDDDDSCGSQLEALCTWKPGVGDDDDGNCDVGDDDDDGDHGDHGDDGEHDHSSGYDDDDSDDYFWPLLNQPRM